MPEVAAALLFMSPKNAFGGVVYLDERDRKVVMMRDSLAGDARGPGHRGAAGASGREHAGEWTCALCRCKNSGGAFCTLCHAPAPAEHADDETSATPNLSIGLVSKVAKWKYRAGARLAAMKAAMASLRALRANPEFRRLLASARLPLERSGLPLSKLFAFYDQRHTTGTHVDLAPNARGLCTVAASTIYRDLAQVIARVRAS